MSGQLTKAQRTAVGLFVLEHALNGTQHAALLELVGQVGALGVPSPEKASDGPATPTDPPCTCTPREGLHHLDCPRFDFGCDCRPTRDGLGVIVCHAHRDSYCQTCGTYIDGEMVGRSRLDPSRCFECADDGP